MSATLPAGCLRLLALCDQDEPAKLSGGDLNVARVLTGRGYLALLPGCDSTFETTDMGRALLAREAKQP